MTALSHSARGANHGFIAAALMELGLSVKEAIEHEEVVLQGNSLVIVHSRIRAQMAVAEKLCDAAGACELARFSEQQNVEEYLQTA
jgi:hypothetical protein